MEFMKDQGELIVAGVLGLIGLGKVYQQNADNKTRIGKLEEEERISLAQCREKQDHCHILQKSYHTGLEKDINSLREAIKAIQDSNETQHATIIARADLKHDEMMKHLMALNNSRQGGRMADA